MITGAINVVIVDGTISQLLQILAVFISNDVVYLEKPRISYTNSMILPLNETTEVQKVFLSVYRLAHVLISFFALYEDKTA